jgi:hypothetical protein
MYQQGFEANTSRRPGKSRSSMLDQLMLRALLDCSPPTSDPEAFQRNQLNPDMVLTYEAFIIQKVMANALPASRGIESVSTPLGSRMKRGAGTVWAGEGNKTGY